MKDILGREVCKDDLVVAKGTGKYNNGLRVGLMRERSIRFLNGNTAGYNQLFKITNPTDEELKIKQEILDYERNINESKQKSENERRSKKAIPKKELEVGYMYLDDKGDKYYYLGKGKVHKSIDEWNDRWVNKISEEGYVIIEIDSIDQEYYGLDLCYDHMRRKRKCVRKTIPRFVEKLDIKIDTDNRILEFIEDKEKPNNYYSYYMRFRSKYTIELEDK